MSSSSSSTPSGNFFMQIEKLKGRENFLDWKFAVKTYLEHENLFKHITLKTPVEISNDAKAAEMTATKEAKKTRSRLIMLIDPVNYVHVRDAKTPAEVWEKLCSTFEGTGITGRVRLIRELALIRLSECESVEIYVTKIINTAHKLRSIGMDISDEFIGMLLLGGLSDDYKPMIMGIESSGIKITADAIKNKLLLYVKCESTERESALAAKFRKGKRDKSKVSCYNCNQFGHYSRDCKRTQTN